METVYRDILNSNFSKKEKLEFIMNIYNQKNIFEDKVIEDLKLAEASASKYKSTSDIMAIIFGLQVIVTGVSYFM